MSLQAKLYESIKQAYPNVQKIDNLFAICHELGYKESNGERQLRKLAERKAIIATKNTKGYITGYLYLYENDYILTPKSTTGQAIAQRVVKDATLVTKTQERLFKPQPIIN